MRLIDSVKPQLRRIEVKPLAQRMRTEYVRELDTLLAKPVNH